MQGAMLVGRAAELERVRALLDTGGALLVRGVAGIGKSALLDEGRGRSHADRGMIVLPDTARSSRRHVCLSRASIRLLRPVLPHVAALPDPQRDALLSAFGMSDDAAPDPFLIALAALELLSEAASHAPLVLLADDAHWFDGATADVLAFVARRVGDDRVAIVAALRDGEPLAADRPLCRSGSPRPDGLNSASPRSTTRPPPSCSTAWRRSSSERRRARILEAAGGNPLALSELPRAPAEDAPPAGPALVPLTARLERTFAARASGLPAASRALLLVAAANDDDTLAEVLARRVGDRRARPHHQRTSRRPSSRDSSTRTASPCVSVTRWCARPSIRRLRSPSGTRPMPRSRPRSPRNPTGRCGTGSHARRDQMTGSSRRPRGRRRTGPAARGDRRRARGALERAARFTADPFRRGVRLLRTTELAAELGRADMVGDLIAATSGLDLAPAERIRLAWMRELYDPHAWSGADRLDAFADIAEQMLEAGLPGEALKALIAVAVRVHWANADDSVRNRILEVADRLPLPRNHPGRIAVLALADPETRGAEALDAIARYAIAPSDDPGVLRLLGSASTAIGAFDLAPSVPRRGGRGTAGAGAARAARAGADLDGIGPPCTPARCASGCPQPRRPSASPTRPASRAGAPSGRSPMRRSRAFAGTRSAPRC